MIPQSKDLDELRDIAMVRTLNMSSIGRRGSYKMMKKRMIFDENKKKWQEKRTALRELFGLHFVDLTPDF